jgi:uncharacterized membrane protein (DUF2068 family)
LIVGYKVAKAALEIAFGAALVLFATKATNELRIAAHHVRDHATAAWSVALADKIVQAATRRHLMVVAVASLLDGVLTSIEGWALHRRYRWGSWLVIAATSCLLPFEVISLARHLTAGRVALFFTNVAIVAYLLRSESSSRPAS